MKEKVSIIVPVYNEEKYIEKCIQSILNQDYPQESVEVIFIDGNSTDNTLIYLKKVCQDHKNFKYYQNIKRTVQYALNIGIKHASGEYIVRLDAHCEYDDSYISNCIKTLESTDADNVGGPTIAVGKNTKQRAIAAAFHSMFALGGGKSHIEQYKGYADTVSFGAYKRSKIIEIGLYDENFPRSEDDEMNLRLKRLGGKIYINPDIKSQYYPRDSFIKLAKQYFEYGFWKPAVLKKHKIISRFSQLIPSFFVFFLLTGPILLYLVNNYIYIYISILNLYLMLDFLFSFSNRKTSTLLEKIYLFLSHFIIHISYGTGYILGFIKFIILR